MTYGPDQPPEHPAAVYYPPPAHALQAPKDLTALGEAPSFATACLATLFPALDSWVIGRAIRSGGDQGDLATADWSVSVHYLGNGLTFVALLGGWITASMWLFRAQRRRGAHARLPPRATRRVGVGWLGVPHRLLLVPLPGGARRARRGLAAAPHGPHRLVVGAVPDRAHRPADLGGASSRRAHQGHRSGRAEGFAVIIAVVMVAALVAWGLVLRQITREQHAQMYGAR